MVPRHVDDTGSDQRETPGSQFIYYRRVPGLILIGKPERLYMLHSINQVSNLIGENFLVKTFSKKILEKKINLVNFILDKIDNGYETILKIF